MAKKITMVACEDFWADKFDTVEQAIEVFRKYLAPVEVYECEVCGSHFDVEKTADLHCNEAHYEAEVEKAVIAYNEWLKGTIDFVKLSGYGSVKQCEANLDACRRRIAKAGGSS